MKSLRAASTWLCWFAAFGVAAGEPGVIIETNVPAVMRDGVVLRADVHRPDRGGPYPVLVWRTPYGKHKKQFEQYVKGGYIVVCQDVRGRYASDGTWESWLRPQTHDAEDGYDTVQWAARLPGASGKVGTIGFSYGAFYQWKLAALRPPALGAMSAHSIPATYPELEGPGTIRPGRRLRWSMVTMMPDVRRRANRPGTHTEAEASALWDGGEGQKWLYFLPWLDLPQEVFEDDMPYLRTLAAASDHRSLEAGRRLPADHRAQPRGRRLVRSRPRRHAALPDARQGGQDQGRRAKARSWSSAPGAISRPAAASSATLTSVPQPT